MTWLRSVVYMLLLLEPAIITQLALADSFAPMEFSRLILYDVRGPNEEEIALIFEQKGDTVLVVLKDYLGKRVGSVPEPEYLEVFLAMRTIKEFSLKPKYRGHLLRKNAAHGMITLAWKDQQGKQIKSIKYYAPENNLDDFRAAYNRIWGLSRYAILSRESLASQRVEVVEDAIYFLSGAGWMTLPEIQSVISYYKIKGSGLLLAQDIWNALERNYSPAGEFSQPEFVEHCIMMGMIQLQDLALQYLRSQKKLNPRQAKLADKICREIQKNKTTASSTPLQH